MKFKSIEFDNLHTIGVLYQILYIVKTPQLFGLVSLFNGISTFVGYLMPKPFS